MSPRASWILQEEIVPRLIGAVPRSVLCVGSEDHQELVQDSIVMAAKMLDRVDRQGKLGKVSASNVAYYTIQHLKSGRRANGSRSVDALGSSTQLNGSSRLNSLSEVVAECETGEIFELNDVLSNDQEDPSQIAARKMDWDAFLIGLSDREKCVVENLLAGRNMSEIARIVKLDPTTIHNYRNKLAVKILDYMGPDILRDIEKRPRWRENLNANRERLACKNHRRN